MSTFLRFRTFVQEGHQKILNDQPMSVIYISNHSNKVPTMSPGYHRVLFHKKPPAFETHIPLRGPRTGIPPAPEIKMPVFMYIKSQVFVLSPPNKTYQTTLSSLTTWSQIWTFV